MTRDPLRLPLRPPSTARCAAPAYVDPEGCAVDEPHAVLGLPVHDGPPDPAEVQEAYRAALLAHPPDADPTGAARRRAARDRLVDPDHLLARELGVLHVPDPAAWALPAPVPAARGPLTPEARLLGQAVLYALLEEELWTHGLGARFEAAIAAGHEG